MYLVAIAREVVRGASGTGGVLCDVDVSSVIGLEDTESGKLIITMLCNMMPEGLGGTHCHP
jgi:hypothetical protein